MAGSLTVRQARLVLPDRVVVGDLVVEDGIITQIAPRVEQTRGLQIDGRGCALLPGLVDVHVHLDACEDLESVSMGAAAGGVTTVLGSDPPRPGPSFGSSWPPRPTRPGSTTACTSAPPPTTSTTP